MNQSVEANATGALDQIERRSIVHLAPATPELVNASLQAVEDAFNKQWLSRPGTHCLQRLWRRNDALATSELFCLGQAISRLKIDAPGWLRHTVKNAREVNPSAHGFLTEIIVCGQLTPKNGRLIPAGKKQSGYDAVAEYRDGTKHFISIKSHKISSHETKFRQFCEQIREAFRNKLQQLRTSQSMYVFCETTIRIEHINKILAHLNQSSELRGEHKLIPGELLVIYAPIDPQLGRISAAHISDHVLVLAPEHPNEQLRFRTKVREAAENLGKHVPRNRDNARIIYMRVHPTADLTKLSHDIQDRLSGINDLGFDAIFLLQPAVVRTGEASQINHSFVAAVNGHYAGQVVAGRSFIFTFGIGSVTIGASQSMLTTSSGQPFAALDKQYVYQQGEYFILADQASDGSFTGNITNLADGVVRHSVFKLEGNEITLGGIFPPSDDLLIV